MTTITTNQIMDYVKDFLTQAAEEEWDFDFLLETWEEKNPDISAIIEANKPKTKKASTPKDPNKPKRGRTAYNYFCQHERAEVKASLDDEAKSAEVMTALGAKWTKTKNSQKTKDKEKMSKYTKMAVEDKKRAALEMEGYVPPSDEELAALKPKKSRKSSSGNSKPKKGRTAYNFFCTEMRPKVKERYGLTDNTEIVQKLGVLWAEFKDDEELDHEHDRFKQMAVDDKLRYEKEMETYIPSEDEQPKPKKTKISAIEKEGFKKYCNTYKEDLKEEQPELTASQITKLLKEEWAQLDEAEKKEWAEEDQEGFEDE